MERCRHCRCTHRSVDSAEFGRCHEGHGKDSTLRLPGNCARLDQQTHIFAFVKGAQIRLNSHRRALDCSNYKRRLTLWGSLIAVD